MIGRIRDQNPDLNQGSETGSQEAADLRLWILRRSEFGWEGVSIMRPYCLSGTERKIYRRYAEIALPRHTSYPIASVWTNAYGPSQFRDRELNKETTMSASVHSYRKEIQ